MNDFLLELLQRFDQLGPQFTHAGFLSVSANIMPTLNLLTIAYVAYFGVQLLLGVSRIGVGEVVGRVVRIMLILALISHWEYFNALIYGWISVTPEGGGRLILEALGSNIISPTLGLSNIWRTANVAAAEFSMQTGPTAVLPAVIGGLIILLAAVFASTALALMIMAKVMVWALVATAPIFISCLLFPQSRNIGRAWISQLLAYGLLSFFIYVIAAFLIYAVTPENERIINAINNNALKLNTFSAFMILCGGGALVLIRVLSLTQNLAKGLTDGVVHVFNAYGGSARSQPLERPSYAASGRSAMAGPLQEPVSDHWRREDGGMRTTMQNQIRGASAPF